MSATYVLKKVIFMGYIIEITVKSFVTAFNHANKLVGQAIHMVRANDYDNGSVGCCG